MHDHIHRACQQGLAQGGHEDSRASWSVQAHAHVVSVEAASRSYVPGAIPAGTWSLLIGQAKVIERPARYHVEIFLRPTPTLSPQPERRPYAHAPAPPAPSPTRQGRVTAPMHTATPFGVHRGTPFALMRCA